MAGCLLEPDDKHCSFPFSNGTYCGKVAGLGRCHLHAAVPWPASLAEAPPPPPDQIRPARFVDDVADLLPEI